jgi:hypothetical protein
MAENPIADSRDTLDSGVRPGERMGNPAASGNNRFSADLKPLQELDAALTKLHTNINKFKTDLPKVITLTEQWAAKMQKVANAMNGMGGGKGGPTSPSGPASPNGAPAGTLTDSLLGGGGGGGMFNTYHITTDRSQNLTMMGGGGGRGGGGGAAATGADIAKQIAGAIGAALNNRINNNAAYSLSANRMDMLLQQTTGMSGQEVRDNKRKPLTQYKLGAGGINSVLSLEASTGIDANKQGNSVEFLRAASGYGYSTDQVNQMTKTMAGPESANRMFMTMGTGMYGVGGQQRSAKEVVQRTVQRLGLTTESSLQGAMTQGSMTRERLRQSGVPEEMQDITLQYAKENIAFKKKGGRGMYDAANKYDRKIAGVEDTYANQNEETERVKASREENMYDKQADNYAAMEKGMQSLTRALQKLDDTFSSAMGFKARNRGAAGIAGAALKGAALPLSFIPGVGPALGIAAGVAGAFLGDATGEKEPGAKKGGTGGNVAKSSGQLSKLHPKMREKVEAMMKANPRLYIGGGVRSTEQQKQLFESRYEPTPEKTDVFWKGQYWKRVRGAAAAPPGMSMHEIGLAVDFAPSTEFDWVKEHAKDFGLRSFHDVNNEPWHVQPAELPGSRSQYEKMGAPWGHNGVVAEPTDTNAAIKGLETMMHGGVSSMGGSSGKQGVDIKIQGYAGLSMGAAIEAMGLDLQGAGGGGSLSAASLGGGSPGSGSSSGSSSVGSYSGKGPLTGRQVAAIMYKAGFRGKRLVEAVAIAHRESRFNPKSFADDDDDLSYGLMQINMKGSMGPARRGYYNLKKNEELFNPATNARVAWKLSGHGNNWEHWKDDTGNPLGNTNIPQATKYVKEAGYATSGHPKQGDPVSGMGMAMSAPTRGGSVVVQGDSGNTFHVSIAPTINLNGGNNYSGDVERMAKDVAHLLDREVRMALLRNS